MSFAEDLRFNLIFSIPGYETNKRITLFGIYDSWIHQRGKADWAYLVKQNFVTCVNILEDMTSIYKWKDDLEEDGEVVMTANTRKNTHAATN